MDAYVSSLSCAGPAHPPVLGLDITGRPLQWFTWMEAATLLCREVIAWTAGDSVTDIFGGTNRLTGRRSCLKVNSIIAVRANSAKSLSLSPPLSNLNLFARDQYHCLYCGGRFPISNLSRDHIVPASRGGSDVWTNAATACKRCNSAKGNRTPEEAGMPLLVVPFVPSYCEHLILSNRRILDDQMRYLSAHVPLDRRGRYGAIQMQRAPL